MIQYMSVAIKSSVKIPSATLKHAQELSDKPQRLNEPGVTDRVVDSVLK